MGRLTLDTGALIALEKKRGHYMNDVVEVARRDGIVIEAPANAIAEWWRSGDRKQREIRESLTVAEVTEVVAKLAGEALASIYETHAARIDAKTTIDATVMATAALSGGAVYTGDFDDLSLFAAFFPNVRLFGLARPKR